MIYRNALLRRSGSQTRKVRRHEKLVLAGCNVDRNTDGSGSVVQTDISTRTSEALAPYVWTGFDIEGRDVTVKGIAPDPAEQEAARAALRAVWGINDITDLTSVLPATSPYVFKIEKSNDSLVFSGSIPENALRDQIMEAAEAGHNSPTVFFLLSL
jgi:hypothetical protein